MSYLALSVADQLKRLATRFEEGSEEVKVLAAVIDNGGSLKGLDAHQRLVWERKLEPLWVAQLHRSQLGQDTVAS